MLPMDARGLLFLVACLVHFFPTISVEGYRDHGTTSGVDGLSKSFIRCTGEADDRNGRTSSRYYSTDKDETPSVDNDISNSPEEQGGFGSPSKLSHRRMKSAAVSHGRQVNWNFGYQNTDEWNQHHPECYGSRQSPVDINSNRMTRLNVPSPFTWKGYRATPRKMTLVNNGHSVQLNAFWDNKDDEVPYISGGTLVGDYAFHQLHFHWGSSDGTGSEHTINNRSLPLEMHMVHYKKAYGSADEAGKHDDGLAVVGIFFELGTLENKGIRNLQKHTAVAINPNSTVQIWPFPLSNFGVKFPGEYVSYLGSLTTPPCSEIVTWVLPAYARFITRAQLNIFRRIRLAGGDKHNYRPTRPLNGRRVYYISY